MKGIDQSDLRGRNWPCSNTSKPQLCAVSGAVVSGPSSCARPIGATIAGNSTRNNKNTRKIRPGECESKREQKSLDEGCTAIGQPAAGCMVATRHVNFVLWVNPRRPRVGGGLGKDGVLAGNARAQHTHETRQHTIRGHTQSHMARCDLGPC